MAKTKAELEQEKQRVGIAAAKLESIRPGMRIGLGSGTTIRYFIQALGQRMKQEGFQLEAVATSQATEDLARSFGITLIAPYRGLRLDLTVDGADEISPQLGLIKGGGGALLREKIVACASNEMVAIADSAKVVSQLGRFPLPLEVIAFAVPWVMDQVQALGGSPQLRMNSTAASPTAVLTDQGNHLIDCAFQHISDPAELASQLERISGVVEHGLFLNIATKALIANGDKIEILFP